MLEGLEGKRLTICGMIRLAESGEMKIPQRRKYV